MINRRRFSRFNRSLIAYYRRAGSEEFEAASLTRDVSEGGIQMDLDEPFAVGDRLVIELSLAATESPVVADCRVMRKDGASAGIEFERMSDGDRARIAAYVKMRVAAVCA